MTKTRCIFDKFNIRPPEPRPTDECSWIISGAVASADMEEGTVTLWLNGMDHLETVPIDPKMPGWMLAPDMSFRTTVPRAIIEGNKTSLNDVVWGEFYTMPYSCMTEEELLEQLTEIFYPPKKGGNYERSFRVAE